MPRATRVFLAFCVIAAIVAFAVRQALNGRAAIAKPEAGTIRIATWNLCWLLEETSPARLRKMRSVITSLQADVIAMQEVESRSILRSLLPPDYSIAMIDDPKEDQELAVAVRKPSSFAGEPEMLFAGAQFDYAFPARRNVLRVRVNSPQDELVLYVVHYKSRAGGRLSTDPSRIAESRFLLDTLKAREDARVVLLGDFNDTPDDTSVEVLETGSYDARRTGNPYLVNLMQPFYDDDYVTQGYFRMYRGSVQEPIVRGAKVDNDRLRGMNYSFPRDVRVTQALFDQILVSPSLAEKVVATGIYFGENALTGKEPDVRRDPDGNPVIYKQGTLASDHLPVYADLKFSATESSAAPK